MSIEKTIVLDADPVQLSQLESFLRRQQCDVATATTLRDAREHLRNDSFDIIFMALRLPDGDGRQLLQEITTQTQENGRRQGPLVVVITAPDADGSATRCIADGAFDSITKPCSEEKIANILRKAAEITRLVRVNRLLSHQTEDEEHQILGDSPETEALRELIHKVARTQATVLIQGESGTGKEAVARALYRQSTRNRAPYIRVNCAAIPENLIESEFFGHEKGAFTGATARREGRFELAHGGTILLDEISEISPQVQAKLLRVLQEREFERVGGNRTLRVDVRVIATTNRDLKESVARKEFRQDLYYRLNVVPIHLHPLRQRPQDILKLKGEFVRRYSRRHGVRVGGITEEAGKILLSYPWPGNVRELQNVIERAVILCNDNEMLEPEHLGLGKTSGAGVDARDNRNLLGGQEAIPTLAEVEKRHILSVLEHCQNNRTRAAELLNMSPRTLRSKLGEYPGNAPSHAGELAAAQA